jgi:hypothetical protein
MRIRGKIVTMTATTAGVLALAAGCGWPIVPTTLGQPVDSAAATCAGTALTSAVRDDQGTAGTHHFTVSFTNTGSRACSVFGYPVLVLRDAQGRLLQPAQPAGVSRTVRLAAGRSATATLTVTPAACSTVPQASSAAVSPPTNDRSTTLPVAIPVCRPTISPLAG